MSAARILAAAGILSACVSFGSAFLPQPFPYLSVAGGIMLLGNIAALAYKDQK